jgi:transaldolase/glucose-6-phosphate isomerase
MANPLVEVHPYGQSLWYDNISRGLITSGKLRAMIEHDGLRGLTSNPSIFEKAIADSTDYDPALEALASRRDLDAKALYEQLALEDIRRAADLFRPVYEQTARRDGYVSLEVSPFLAHDTAGTLAEARRLWNALTPSVAALPVPNVMLKVPGTAAGIPAIRELISEGINVNVTLLLSVKTYEAVADAFMTGLEALVARGGSPCHGARVASFFVSRIDTAVDSLLAERLRLTTDADEQAVLKSLLGQVAIANAKLAHQRYREISESPRWQLLARRGAQTQRLLWGSTSTKNPAYRDVRYVEELIGPETVNTMPAATFDAFRDHGRPRASLDNGLDEARKTMETMAQVGISIDAVTDRLVEDGVRLFADAFDQLLGVIERKRQTLLKTRLDRQTGSSPEDLQQPLAPPDGQFPMYVAELEPLVERSAPEVSDIQRAFLGRLSDLAPSRTRTARQLSPADLIWLRALENVVHRHQLSYELITNEDESKEDHLWLVPLH